MKRVSWAVVLLVGIIVGCGAGIALNDVVSPPATAQASAGAQRWEHACDRIHADRVWERPLKAEYGNIGFQLVEAIPPTLTGENSEDWVLCFKRPLP
jgi:hypothetical protein